MKYSINKKVTITREKMSGRDCWTIWGLGFPKTVPLEDLQKLYQAIRDRLKMLGHN